MSNRSINDRRLKGSNRLVQKDNYSTMTAMSTHDIPSRRMTPLPSTKQMVTKFSQKEVRMKRKHDVMNMLSDKKISTLIKHLRIPN